MSFSEDIDLFFGDELAETATIVVGTSTSSARVYFDTPSVSALAGIAVVDDPSMVLAADVSVPRGASVTITGTAYAARTTERIGDGRLQRVTLEAA